MTATESTPDRTDYATVDQGDGVYLITEADPRGRVRGVFFPEAEAEAEVADGGSWRCGVDVRRRQRRVFVGSDVEDPVTHVAQRLIRG
ncbi:hypothetical protein GCM10009678_30480 [Actinomadura kijaniata]|uniref:Uncharacterized protein n=1 Tax=Actinomadura namibiensis TaxID=182080 RepID=A0A7W3QLZ7_ACTNM|nr:hypothetical protein [Actinomadura namibiensis]MBA8951986.1 hypothetical protein [Actinomadura namibiensis]